MNNAVHMAYVDTAVNAWLVEAAAFDPATSPWIGVVVASSCTYHAALGFPQPLDAGLAATRIGRSSVTYAVGLFAPGGEEAAADASLTHVYVDRTSRWPQPLGASLRTALATLTRPDTVFG